MQTPSNRFLGALMLVLALLASGPALTGEVEWKAHMDTGIAAFQRGDYSGAAMRFKAALKEAEAFSADDPGVGITLQFFGRSLALQGLYAEIGRAHV